MVQILRPDATISREGWVNQSGGTSSIYAEIDEVTPDDGDYIKHAAIFVAGEPVPTGLYEGGFGEPAEEPDLSGTFTVRFRAGLSDGNPAVSFTYKLYQGTTLIATKTVTLTTTFTTTNFSLSTSEKAKIVTGGDFRFKIQGNPTSGSGSTNVQMSWTEFEIPDAAEGGGGGDPPAPPPGGSSPDQRELKVSTFNIDGHHFYMLQLGNFGTLVYDATTKQWSEWQSQGENRLRVSVAMNWGEEIIAGSFDSNALYNLKTGRGFDLGTTQIVRVVRGKLPMRTRATAQCKAVHFTGSARRGSTVQLRTSDDGGLTWIDHGTKTIE